MCIKQYDIVECEGKNYRVRYVDHIENTIFDLNKIGRVHDVNEGFEPSEDDDVTYGTFKDLISVSLTPYEQKLAY